MPCSKLIKRFRTLEIFKAIVNLLEAVREETLFIKINTNF